MTLEIYGSVWQNDHCVPIASFNLLDENEMKKRFNWIILRPMYSYENNLKKAKIDYRLYLLQKSESLSIYQIKCPTKDKIKLFIDEIYSTPPKKNYKTKKKVYNHTDEIWSIDLPDMVDYKTSNNNGFRYIFVIIDSFSKILRCIPLKKNIVKLSQMNFQIF